MCRRTFCVAFALAFLLFQSQFTQGGVSGFGFNNSLTSLTIRSTIRTAFPAGAVPGGMATSATVAKDGRSLRPHAADLITGATALAEVIVSMDDKRTTGSLVALAGRAPDGHSRSLQILGALPTRASMYDATHTRCKRIRNRFLQLQPPRRPADDWAAVHAL